MANSKHFSLFFLSTLFVLSAHSNTNPLLPLVHNNDEAGVERYLKAHSVSLDQLGEALQENKRLYSDGPIAKQLGKAQWFKNRELGFESAVKAGDLEQVKEIYDVLPDADKIAIVNRVVSSSGSAAVKQFLQEQQG